MAPMVLGYWDLRGKGEPIRYMLKYAGADFVDKRYTFGPAPDYANEWHAQDKPNSSLEFPNLPYIFDGDRKISESNAVRRYVARKFGLFGSTEDDVIRIDVAEGVLEDIGMAFARLVYNPDFDKLKDDFMKTIDASMQKLSKLVSGNYILGDKICFQDFVLFELLDRYTSLSSGCYNSFPNLTAFHQRVAQLPAIKSYKASATFQAAKNRYNGPMAKFGSGV